MRAVSVEKYIESLTRLLALRLARLSLVQYRVTCVVVAVVGVLGMYWGLHNQLFPGSLTEHIEPLEELEAKRELQQKQLVEFEATLRDLRGVRFEPAEVTKGTPQGLVHTIDRASRQSRVHVEGVQAQGRGASGGKGARYRHQVVVTGTFTEISAFVSDISEQHSSSVVVDLELKSPEWSYPEQPLRATLLVEAALDDAEVSHPDNEAE
jgi:hypothetical protein